MDTCRASFGNIQHLIEINETLQLKVPPLLLNTLPFFFASAPCYRSRARCPKSNTSFQRKCKVKHDHLRCPSYPTTIPTFISDASNRNVKEHLVRRMIDTSSLCRISLLVSLCNIFLYPRQKLGSLRGRHAKKKAWITAASQRDPSIDKGICSSTAPERTTRLGSPKVDAPTLPGSRKLQ